MSCDQISMYLFSLVGTEREKVRERETETEGQRETAFWKSSPV